MTLFVDRQRAIGNVALLSSAFLWGIAFVPQRVAMQSIDPLWFNAMRFGIAAFLLYLWQLSRGKGISREAFVISLPLGLCLFGGALLQQIGLIFTTAGKAGFLTCLYFVWVPFIERILYGRTVLFSQWGAVAMGVGGTILLCGQDPAGFAMADGIVLGCAFIFGFHVVLASRIPLDVSPIEVALSQYGICAFFSLVLAVFLEPLPAYPFSFSLVASLFYCTVFSVVIGYTLQIFGQQRTRAIDAALLMGLEAVFAALAGVLLLGEVLTPVQLIGCTLMFTAVTIVQIPFPRRGLNIEPEVF